MGSYRRMTSFYTFQERLPYLLIHGLLHLVGYDHETRREWRRMTRREEEVIQQLLKLPPLVNDPKE